MRDPREDRTLTHVEVSIPPFIAGSGRIGRDVPHFALVNGFREGAAKPLVAYLAVATTRSPRAAASKLIDVLLEHPGLDAGGAARLRFP